VISNAGPDAANGATYLDAIPSALTNLTAICGSATNRAACGATAASLSGNNLTGSIAALPANSSVTITVTGKAPNAPTRFSNSVTVSPPAGVVDPDSSDNIGGPVITQVTGVSALSGYVWIDYNRDNVRNPATESLVQGATVRVLDVNGNPVNYVNAAGLTVPATAVSDATGAYLIPGLVPGPGYQVVFDFTNVDLRATPNVPNFGVVRPANSDPTVNGTGVNFTTIRNITLVDGLTTIDQNARLIDPSGVIYDSNTRIPVPGATATLYFTPTVGGTATVVSNSQLNGGTPNNQLVGNDGRYAFFLAQNDSVTGLPTPTGTYEIRVTPPAGYVQHTAGVGSVVGATQLTVPATTSTDNAYPVQLQITAPAVGISGTNTENGTGTTYHLVFNNFGYIANSQDVIHNHIPLDRTPSNQLMISKVASAASVEIGDSVKYTIRINNPNAVSIGNAYVYDRASAGFTYVPGSARFVSGSTTVAVVPTGTAPALRFVIPVIAANTSGELTYYMRVGAGAAQGTGINMAQLMDQNGQTLSPQVQAKVRVTGGVFSAQACVIGKVYVDCNNNHIQDVEELGIPGVRLFTQDGTSFTTDVEGKYSYCGLDPRTSVLVVDQSTLPLGSALTTSSNRNAGDAHSLFLDLKNGELHRADFIEGSCSAPVLEQVKARRTKGDVSGIVPQTPKQGSTLQFIGKPANGLNQGTDSAKQGNQGTGKGFQPPQIK
jgi:uncharacterized repeat protein (TIGR01451 family)